MKTQLGGMNVLYPTPTVLVGAIVDGKPNFLTIAHIGIVNHAKPFLISLSLGKVHYTNAGIKENKVFSVNLPSENLVVQTDYVGMVSGKKTDKSGVFDIFYGEPAQAPMIEACPLNMECSLYDVYDTPTHDLFIGEIVQTYSEYHRESSIEYPASGDTINQTSGDKITVTSNIRPAASRLTEYCDFDIGLCKCCSNSRT